MRLNPTGTGRGGGNKDNFRMENGAGIMGQRQIFSMIPNEMLCRPIGFSPQAPFGMPPSFGEPSRFKFRPPRRAFGGFPRNNYKKKVPFKSNNISVHEIDLTKPWVGEHIINEAKKEQELLQLWSKSKTNEDWNIYSAQKLLVKSLYDKAKAEYALGHPNQVTLQGNSSNFKKFFCETCDKSFKTENDFLLHTSGHETCGRDGCDFTADPNIIAKHVKMQHLSGLYKRIGKLQSEEDIVKWIEERKNHYPTRKVVEEKKILEQEKLNRGERIKDDNYKFNKQFSCKKKNTAKKKFGKQTQKNNRNRSVKRKRSTSVVQKCLEEEISSFRKGIPAFLGIKSENETKAPEKKDVDISDEEWEAQGELQLPAKPLLNNSLGLIASVYDSEEENQDGELNKKLNTEVISADEGSGPEEVITVSSKNPLTEDNSYDERSSHKKKLLRKRNNQEKNRRNTSSISNFDKRDLTLLEKLLKNEIRHERNVILQCVHFVVKNNFFKT